MYMWYGVHVKNKTKYYVFKIYYQLVKLAKQG